MILHAAVALMEEPIRREITAVEKASATSVPRATVRTGQHIVGRLYSTAFSRILTYARGRTICQQQRVKSQQGILQRQGAQHRSLTV